MQFENSFDVGAPIDDGLGRRARRRARRADRARRPGARARRRRRLQGRDQGQGRADVDDLQRRGRDHRARRGRPPRRDEGARQGVARARGPPTPTSRWCSSARNGGTSATVTTDVQLSGKVATMGQGVLQDVSRRLVETFAGNLATMLEGRRAGGARRGGAGGAGATAGASGRRARGGARPGLARRRRRRRAPANPRGDRGGDCVRRLHRLPARPPLEGRLTVRELRSSAGRVSTAPRASRPSPRPLLRSCGLRGGSTAGR